MTGELVNPFDLLAEEVESEDEYMKLNAYKRMRLIARAMGPENVEKSLLPFLLEKAMETTEDEILLVMAREIGEFVPLVNSPESLFPLVTQLAGTEETVVRDAAVASMGEILKSFTGPVSTGIEVFKGLCAGEWFCSKVSAATLFPSLYERAASEEQKDMVRQQLESTLVGDESPMVRRAVAAAIPDIINVVSMDILASFVVPLFKKLANDDQDLVRIAAIEATVSVAKGLQATGIDDQNQQHVVPIVRSAIEDRSWRVRQAVSKEFADLSLAILGDGGQRAKETLHHELVPGYAALLQDNEAEVRTTACKSYAAFYDLVGVDSFVLHLIPCAQALAPDTVPSVRLALSSASLDLAPKLGQEHFMKFLMPLLERFLIDPGAPDVKVRLHILQRLDVIGQWLPALQETFIPVLVQLREDDNWRIRKAVVGALPVLAEHMNLEIFESRLLPHMFSAFKDRVCEVRIAATQSLHHLARVTGGDFIQEGVLPRIRSLYEESSFYLIRLAVLQALKSLTSEGTPDNLITGVLGLVITATHDKIPNVRFTAAQVLAKVSQLVDDATLTTQIRPCLQELVQSDPDNDVKYYASVALESCG